MSSKQNLALENTMLANKRTKLSNQRTYLAYMRTGFGIASVAGAFNKNISSILNFINKCVTNMGKREFNDKILDLFPVIYVVLSLGTLYLQWKK